MAYPDAVKQAGHEGDGLDPGESLFDAVLQSRRGTVFTTSVPEDSWRRVKTIDGKLHVDVPEMLDRLAVLPDTVVSSITEDFPFVLAAGERRSFTANTIFRDPDWRKRDRDGALRMSPGDAERLGITDGGRVRLSTQRGSIETVVEITDTVREGHITMPNGLGVDYPEDDGELIRTGAAPNELTWPELRDDFAGTPWHKHVPARVEVV